MVYDREFESADEFIRVATEAKNERGWNYWDYVRSQNSPGFYGCVNEAEAKQLAKFGWKQGREAVERMKARIEGELGRAGRTYECKWDVTGAVVDVGAYVAGEPECMINFEETPAEKVGFVDVHFSSGVGGAVSVQEMVTSGAAVCALVDALENMGRRVRLRWERSSTIKSTQYVDSIPEFTLSVVLKDYQDALDMDRLAFFATSPIARRSMPWSIYSLAPRELRIAGGIRKNSALHTFPANHPKFRDAEVWIGAMIGGTESAAASWVLAKLAELGVEVKEGAE